MSEPRGSRPSVSVWLAVALLSAGITFPFRPPLQTEKTSYELDASVGSSASGIVQVFYDVGRGFNETDSSVVQVRSDGVPRPFRFHLPLGKCTALRFDPLDRPGTVTVADARIVDDMGRVLLELPPSRFTALGQVSRMTAEGSKLVIVTEPGANDPITRITLDGPLNLTPRQTLVWWRSIRFFLVVFAVVSAATLASRLVPAGLWNSALGSARAKPKRTLAVAALGAVLLSSSPVVFLGRSFVSPNMSVLLLYETIPTLPGYSDTSVKYGKGSDVGAVMWWHVPVSRIQHESVFHDHEIPLWNRYDLCGQSLLGQGQSMLGDPLHWLTALAGGGSALSWDVKYLAAKWLLALGVGLTVLALTGRVLVSGLLCVSSLFIGFFSFRLNHPAIFSVCYSPWILYSAVRLAQSSTRRAGARWTAAVLLADWMEINSGTVKEAYMLALCLNAAAVLVVLLYRDENSLKAKKLLGLAWAYVLFGLISAPIWTTFLATLGGSFTSYDIPRANQLPWTSAVGFFDDLYYRQTVPFESLVDPSTNFLVLLGVLWAVASAGKLRFNGAVLALACAAVIPAMLVYGVIPPSVIFAVPFLRNVSHIDNTFSCVLIVLALPIAGVGLDACVEGMRDRVWKGAFWDGPRPARPGPWDIHSVPSAPGSEPVLFRVRANADPCPRHRPACSPPRPGWGACGHGRGAPCPVFTLDPSLEACPVPQDGLRRLRVQSPDPGGPEGPFPGGRLRRHP